MKVPFGLGLKFNPEDLARADIPMLTARFRQLAKNALIREEGKTIGF